MADNMGNQGNKKPAPSTNPTQPGKGQPQTAAPKGNPNQGTSGTGKTGSNTNTR